MNPIITALDYPDKNMAQKLVQLLDDRCMWYKIGSVLFTKEGPDIVSFLKKKKKNVFLDLKFHDIPNTVKNAVAAAAELQADLITIHLSGGSEMIKAAAAGAQSVYERTGHRAKVIGVSVLTSINQKILSEDIGIHGSPEETVIRFVDMGLKNGADGIVCSPRETEVLRKRFGDDFIMINPGIRMEEDAGDDQKRVATPVSALRSGASYLVIGRSVTQAEYPDLKMEKIIRSIKTT